MLAVSEADDPVVGGTAVTIDVEFCCRDDCSLMIAEWALLCVDAFMLRPWFV